MPGGRLYHAADFDRCLGVSHDRPRNSNSGKGLSCCEHYYDSNHRRRGWNVFLRPTDKTSRRITESPVYALSKPSHCSPTFFAGVESAILQLDMVSIMDKHVDPLFNYGMANTGDERQVKRKWDPQGNVLCLPMYEHDTGPVKLIKQRKVGCIESSLDGWDERWQHGEPRPVNARQRHHSWGIV